VEEIRPAAETDHPDTLAVLWEPLARWTGGRVGSTRWMNNILRWGPKESGFLAFLSGGVALGVVLKIVPVWGLGFLASVGFLMGATHTLGTYGRRGRKLVRVRISLRSALSLAMGWGVWPILWAGALVYFSPRLTLGGTAILAFLMVGVVHKVHKVINLLWVFHHRIENGDVASQIPFLRVFQKHLPLGPLLKNNRSHPLRELFLLAMKAEQSFFFAPNPAKAPERIRQLVSALKELLYLTLMAADWELVHRFDVAVRQLQRAPGTRGETKEQQTHTAVRHLFQTALDLVVDVEKRAGILPARLEMRLCLDEDKGWVVEETRGEESIPLSLREIRSIMALVSRRQGTPMGWLKKATARLVKDLRNNFETMALVQEMYRPERLSLDSFHNPGDFLNVRDRLEVLDGFLSHRTTLELIRQGGKHPTPGLTSYLVKIDDINVLLNIYFGKERWELNEQDARDLLEQGGTSLYCDVAIGPFFVWSKIDLELLQTFLPEKILLRLLMTGHPKLRLIAFNAEIQTTPPARQRNRHRMMLVPCS